MAKKTKKDLENEIKKLEGRINELEKENSELVKSMKKVGHGKIMSVDIMSDPLNIVGLGAIELDNNWMIRTKVSLDFLKKAISIIKKFNDISYKSSPDMDTIDIAISDESPLMLGRYDEDKKKFVGIIIAPRLDKGEEEENE